MKDKIIENGIEYNLVGDYYLPNLKVGLKGFKCDSELGKKAKERLNYFKNNDTVNYEIMLINGTLYSYLQEDNYEGV